MEKDPHSTGIYFLGRGWSFPPTFSRESETVEMTDGIADIESSLAILFETRVGERIIFSEYGSNLKQYVFEPINRTLISVLCDLITTAVLKYEPRITLLQVEIDDSRQYEGVISIHLEYMVRTTNSRHNFVYPFYLEEGNQLQV